MLNEKLQLFMKQSCVECSRFSKDPKIKACCSQCNVTFCNDCIQESCCIKCNKLVCESHSNKCSICSKRTCTGNACMNIFPVCQICQVVYCNDHFEAHKKFNQSEPFKLRCNFERCKITQGIHTVEVESLCKNLCHMPFLKELRLRTRLSRKQ